MTETTTDDILTEVWDAKDSLSASYGNDLSATCRALYAEQEKTPEKFVNFGVTRAAQQDADDQSATAASSKAQ